MSITPSNSKEERKNLLSISWNFQAPADNNIVVLDEASIAKSEEKKEKIKVDKPKPIKTKTEPAIRMYYEAILEAYNKGIRNRCHTFDLESDNNLPTSTGKTTYYCPLACVTELLKLCKPSKKNHPHARQYNHYIMQDRVFERIQFVNDPNNRIYCKQTNGSRLCEYFEYTSEPLYSIHLANAHRIRNDDVAAILKKELYDGNKSYKLYHDPKFVEMQNKNAEKIALEKENARKAQRKQYRLERRQRLKALS